MRKKEETDKDNIINSVYKDARRSGKYFYIASMHDDCASDHKDYQGKVYVDRYCYDADALAYAREHGIRTVQWVMRNPVWFITRPNCRHYFKTATLGTIKSGRYYIPHTKVGRKSMQTPRGATLEYLQDRLAMLNQMYAKRPTQMLKHKILKTKLLIDQYKRQQV